MQALLRNYRRTGEDSLREFQCEQCNSIIMNYCGQPAKLTIDGSVTHFILSFITKFNDITRGICGVINTVLGDLVPRQELPDGWHWFFHGLVHEIIILLGSQCSNVDSISDDSNLLINAIGVQAGCVQNIVLDAVML